MIRAIRITEPTSCELGRAYREVYGRRRPGLFRIKNAHEDEAERAVRAGLDLIEGSERPSSDTLGGGRKKPLAARAGIATGLVMVGDLIGEGRGAESRR